MGNGNKPLLTIHIDGNKLLLNRKGKANKSDLMVSRGCGEHVAVEHKEKTKQKQKNICREAIRGGKLL